MANSHVINNKEFTERLAMLSSREPPHIQKYITTVIRKYFLKNWERIEKIEKAPQGVPVFYGLSDKEGKTHSSSQTLVIQTKNGPEASFVHSGDPMYEQLISGEAVYLDLEYMAEIQNEIQDVLIWMKTVYSKPRDLTVMPYLDAKSKAKIWHLEADKRRERDRLKLAEQSKKNLEEGSVPIFTIRSKFMDLPEKDWFVYNLSSKESLEYEGVRLHHCVALYWPQVERGETWIWSLRSMPTEPVLTLQVSPYDKNLYQAKGLQNSNPTHEENVVVKKLAEFVGIELKLFPSIANPLFDQQETVNIENIGNLPGWKIIN
jgi:hypothetical protein